MGMKTPLLAGARGAGSEASGGGLASGGHTVTKWTYAADLANLIKAYLGSNYLGLPFAFQAAGMWLGVIMLVFVAAVTRQGCVLLVRVKRRLEDQGRPVLTYPEVAEAVLGTFTMHLVRLLLVFTQFLFCVGYFIFLSETLRDLVGHGSLSKVAAVAVFVPPIALTSLVREVHKLRPFSVFANIALLTGFVVVLVVEFLKDDRDGTRPMRKFRFSGLPLLFGILTSAFEGIGCLLPIESSLRIPRRHFERLLDTCLLIVSFILGSFAVVGMLTYGDETKDIVITNLPNSPAISVLKVCLLIGIMFTYPLQLVPVTRIAERQLLFVPAARVEVVPAPSESDAPPSPAGGPEGERRSGSLNQDQSEHGSLLRPRFEPRQQQLLENALRLVLVLATAGLSLAIPNFHTVVGLVGSLGASGLAFVVPALLAAFGPDSLHASKSAQAVHAIMVVFGVVGGVAGTYTTLRDA